MPRTIRFHLDEHCDPAIAVGLRRHGIDVTTTLEAGLEGAADEVQLFHGLALERVVFTQDRDYLRIAASGMPHAGIAYCRQQTRSIGEIIEALALIWDIYETEEMANRIEYI